jgi:multicomponent Na+:H+ antiporter subunit E
MLGQIGIHFVIALIWMLLHSPFTLTHLFVGWLFGIVIVYAMTKLRSQHFYLLKLWYVIVLVLSFFGEMFKSSFILARHVFTPWQKMRSGVIAYETKLRSPGQVVLLANMITIIPGSCVLEISPDNRIFYIHVFDFADEEEFRQEVRVALENRIRKVVQ